MAATRSSLPLEAILRPDQERTAFTIEVTGIDELPGYRLIHKLGEGAMGVVYRAQQLEPGGQPLRDVALKMIRSGIPVDATFVERFVQEARIAANLHSSHVLTLYGFGQGRRGQLYYSMELMHGRTLRELLRRHGPLPPERAVAIAAQICEALSEAHGLPEPVVHRDLKPPNIFIEERLGREHVKVGDFGIAKVLREQTAGLTQSGQSPGTPRYMAPEQWQRAEAIDGRVDLYALGVILFEMLSGAPPFAASDLPTLMQEHLSESPPPLPSSVPAALQSAVIALLAKNACDRPPTALATHALSRDWWTPVG